MSKYDQDPPAYSPGNGGNYHGGSPGPIPQPPPGIYHPQQPQQYQQQHYQQQPGYPQQGMGYYQQSPPQGGYYQQSPPQGGYYQQTPQQGYYRQEPQGRSGSSVGSSLFFIPFFFG